MDILTQIVNRTREILSERKQHQSLAVLKQAVAQNPRKTLSLREGMADDKPNIIAEFKRKSPSRPNINLAANPVTIAMDYEQGGAAAMSVLTEPAFFSGAPQDLIAIRERVGMPLLRKDFMVDPYQFYEARHMGADLVLLIARILEPAQIREYCDLAHELGLEVLCEIHNREELARTQGADIDFLGVNCRDLKRFETNLDHLVDMAQYLPAHIPWVAESGIADPDDVRRLFGSGYRLFLIGEYLMKSSDPQALLARLRQP